MSGFTGSAANDLGAGAGMALQQQQQDQANELKKKGMQDQKMAGFGMSGVQTTPFGNAGMDLGLTGARSLT